MVQKNPKRSLASIPNHKAVQNREVLQRLNFLHQSANYLATFTSPGITALELAPTAGTVKQDPNRSASVKESHEGPASKEKLFKKIKRRSQKSEGKICQAIDGLPMIGLSRILSKSMKVISKKAVTRMDPSVKRSICQSCHLLLIPGFTSSTRINPSGPHRHEVKITCSACRHGRKIPHSPEMTAPENPSTDPSTPHRPPKGQRQARGVPFWRQPQHVTFAGQTVVEGGQ